jgi:hypothetical protein
MPATARRAKTSTAWLVAAWLPSLKSKVEFRNTGKTKKSIQNSCQKPQNSQKKAALRLVAVF